VPGLASRRERVRAARERQRPRGVGTPSAGRLVAAPGPVSSDSRPSGRAMLAVLAEGTRDPATLAELARGE
jgi:hypothetical protein